MQEKLDIRLRRVGNGLRLTFAGGEADLSAWIHRNTAVAWVTCPEPWLLEEELIEELSLPLNLDQNDAHPFHAKLAEIRRLARQSARRGML